MKAAYIGVVGNGAIGSLLCAHAQISGMQVTRALRDTTEAVTHVSVLPPDANGPLADITLADSILRASRLTEFAPVRPLDLVVLPLKVYQLADAIKQWRPMWQADTPLLLLQNGMGGENIVRSLLPQQPLYLATTSHGGLKQDRKVMHTGLGETLLGCASTTPPADNVVSLIQPLLPPVRWQTNMQLALWQKLSVNLVINPLTAIHNIRNGEITSDRFTSIVKKLCAETAAVMCACGFDESAATIEARVLAVASATAGNFSSMQQDIAHQRPTEIDAITGYLLGKAAEHKINVPGHADMYQRIQALQTA